MKYVYVFITKKKLQSNNTNSVVGKDELQVSDINAATGKKHCCTLFKNINMYKIMHINFTTRVESHKFVSAAVIALGVNKEP